MRLLLLLFYLVSSVLATNFTIKIDPTPVRTLSDKFLSFSIDSSFALPDLWKQIDFSFVKPLANALAPAYFRWGGTAADLTIFQETNNGTLPQSLPECLPNSIFANQCAIITGEQIETLYNFSKDAGLRFIYDLNLMLRIGAGSTTVANFHNTTWNSTNAQQIINYTSSRGFDMDWELGNEPDGFPVQYFGLNMTGAQVVQAFQELRNILNSNSLYKNSILIGPSACCMNGEIRSFVDAGGDQYVNALTAHHYYFMAKSANISDFLNPKEMNSYESYLTAYITEANNSSKPLWNGETSSAAGGGAYNLSDRYVAGFLWIDKLGISAKIGIEVVIRQALVGGGYCLINPYENKINPDYWLTFAYKKLVGNTVLNVTFSMDQVDLNFRLYGASSRNNDGFVLYGQYSGNTSFTIDIPQLTNKQATLYLFKEGEPGNLQSDFIRLNDQPLKWRPHDPMAYLGGTYTTLPVTLPQYSFFFIMVNQTIKSQTCPDGWYQESTVSNKCLKIVNFTQPWFSANFDCITYGYNASLISIDSAFENTEVLGYVKSSSCSQIYLGLFKNGTDWMWSNIDLKTYRNWKTGYPTTDATQNCATFDPTTSTWVNSDCDTSQCYICQILV